jgi:ABC-type cobalamin/Fe3+-siderophores transport system ATPase subunit
MLLDRGRVVADGTAEETLSPRHIEAVFGVRAAPSGDGMVFELPAARTGSSAPS